MAESDTKTIETTDQDEIFLKRVFRNFRQRLWKNKIWIGGTILAALVLTFLWTSIQTAYYKATAKILINTTGPSNEEVKNLSNLALQEAIIKSAEIVDKVMKINKLNMDQVFSAEENPRETFISLIETELDHKSKTIEIGFLHPSAEKAAAIANSLTETYLNSKASRRAGVSEESIGALKAQIQEKLVSLKKTKERIAQISREHPEFGDENVLSEQIKSLNQQYIAADTKVLLLGTTISEIDMLIEKGEDVIKHAYVRNHPAVSEKSEKIKDLELEELELKQEYREMHPVVLKTQAKLEALRRSFQQEKNNVVTELREQKKFNEASREKLQETMQALQLKVKDLTPQKLEYKNLLNDETATTEAIKTLNAKISDSIISASLAQTGIDILEYATPPQSPYKPNKIKALFFALFFSAFLTMGPLFFFCYMDRTLRNSEDVEHFTQKPFLGQVPFATVEKGNIVPKFSTEKEMVYFNNYLRLIAANINFLAGGENKKTVLITGSKPGEGKTFVTYHLGHAMARSGKNTVLIDADFCRSSLSFAFPPAAEDKPGLHHFLMENADMEQIIEETAEPNLFLIRSREAQFSAPHALRSDRMKSLLNGLKNYFDVILIDAPPVLLINDALALGELVDLRLLIVCWGKTSKDDVLRALSKLAPGNLVSCGLVLNQVRHPESSYYYGYYGSEKKDQYRHPKPK